VTTRHADKNAATQKNSCADAATAIDFVLRRASVRRILDVSSLNLAVPQGAASFFAVQTRRDGRGFGANSKKYKQYIDRRFNLPYTCPLPSMVRRDCPACNTVPDDASAMLIPQVNRTIYHAISGASAPARRIGRDRRAVTAVEYGIVAAFLCLSLLGIFRAFGSVLTTMFNGVSTGI
jgi:Flp pilus assembly pilin Flp